ncbi:hypothetical protein Tco_0323487 [Tanacetum coccineum]
MASDLVSSDPVPQCPITALEHGNLSPGPQSQENVPQVAETVTTLNELDLLFSLMFDELLNGTTLVVSKSFTVHAADAPDKRQQHNSSSLEPQCQMTKYDSHDVNDRVGKSIRSLFDKYFNGENQVVSKSFTVTTADAFDKCQQQPDSTSSTSTLVTTVTTDGNFDL